MSVHSAQGEHALTYPSRDMLTEMRHFLIASLALQHESQDYDVLHAESEPEAHLLSAERRRIFPSTIPSSSDIEPASAEALRLASGELASRY